MLSQWNKMWIDYKNKNHCASDCLLDEVRFDAPEGVEASFDLNEMLAGRFILHLTKRIHIYRSEFVSFLLWHEFTHLMDFLEYPYEKPTLDELQKRLIMEENVNTASDRSIFGTFGEIHLPRKRRGVGDSEEDPGKKLYEYMNIYSEFHACQVSFGRLFSRRGRGRIIDVTKNQVPGPFRDVSVQKLLSDCLRQAHFNYLKFSTMLLPQIFILYFRQIMYLFGYVSYFGNDIETICRCLKVLGVDDLEDKYIGIYQVLKEKDVDRILAFSEDIYAQSYVPFVKDYIRRNYDPGLYTEEELEKITPENFHSFVEVISNRKGGRLWSGRVSPVFGVNDVNKAYRGVDPETIRKMVETTRELPDGGMKSDFDTYYNKK